MKFEDALRYATELGEDCCVMRDEADDFHVIRAFGIEHWKKHYEVVTTVEMVPKITGRTK